MAEPTDIKNVTHITADAIGPPGQRVFYLQAQKEARTYTLVTEKFQVQSLAIGIEQFIAEIAGKFPDLADAGHAYDEKHMRIHPPVDPIFRVGELALGYDVDEDLVILVVREILTEEQEPAEARVMRFWCTREQIRKLAHWGLEIVGRGRPICPQCGAPMDDESKHFCPKKNGHRTD
jgi:uncharacterized repeat protein (TIGR03847 family)